MNKIVCRFSTIFFCIVLMLGTTGCVSVGTLLGIGDWIAGFEVMKEYHASFEYNDEQMADIGNQIVDALIAKDIDALKEIMSPFAVDTDDFEKGFEYSCSFFDEEIVSRELHGCTNGTLQGVYRRSSSAIVLTTVNQKEIVVSFKCYFTHRRESDKIGVDCITVTTPNSIHPNEHDDYYRNRSGIYNPEWNDVVDE